MFVKMQPDTPHSHRTKDENKNENGLVTNVGVTRGTLLQTAKAEIFYIERDEKLTTRLLLHSGSQRSYITDNLRELLKLKIIRSEGKFQLKHLNR